MKTFLSTLYLPAALVVALLVLSACEDPSNVGLGLVGEQGGRPITTEAQIVDFDADSLERPPNVPTRVLAGRVEDPLIGTMTADGYLDFTPVSSSEFRDGTVQSSELRLSPTFVYGDTTADVTLALRPVSVEWDDDDLPVDTAFSVGAVIVEFTFDPTDTLVVVPLPGSWVSDNESLLRGEDFGEDFHGFRLDQTSGGAVVGFGPTGTSLFSRTEEDSAAFPIGKAYSALRKEGGALPGGRRLVQAGVGPEARFELRLDEEASTSAINRAALTFHADTAAVLQDVPPGFVRPMIRSLDLYGLTTEGGLVLLARSNLDEEGRFIFRSDLLAREIQTALLGTRTYEQFELRIPMPDTTPTDQSEIAMLPASLSVALLYDAESGELSPTAHLTLTPIDG